MLYVYSLRECKILCFVLSPPAVCEVVAATVYVSMLSLCVVVSVSMCKCCLSVSGDIQGCL